MKGLGHTRPRVSDRTVSILTYFENTSKYPYYAWETYLGKIRDWSVVDAPQDQGYPNAPRTVLVACSPDEYREDSRKWLKSLGNGLTYAYEAREYRLRAYWRGHTKPDGTLADVVEVRDGCIILEGAVLLF